MCARFHLFWRCCSWVHRPGSPTGSHRQLRSMMTCRWVFVSFAKISKSALTATTRSRDLNWSLQGGVTTQPCRSMLIEASQVSIASMRRLAFPYFSWATCWFNTNALSSTLEWSPRSSCNNNSGTLKAKPSGINGCSMGFPIWNKGAQCIINDE